MDLQKATVTMALLMKKELDFCQECLKRGKDTLKAALTPEESREFDYIQANTREFGNQLASMPDFFDVLESQEVVVSGKEGVSVESLNMAMDIQDADDLIARAGSLAQSVKEYMVAKGFPLANIGVGENGWDVSALCTEKQSRTLCEEIRGNYQAALGFGLLMVSRRFVGQHIPGLYNTQDAVRILNAYGDDIPEL